MNWVFRQPNLKNIEGKYRVKNLISSGFIINHKGTNILVVTKIDFNFNDLVKIKGQVKKPENFSNFDFVSYLKTLNIKNIINYPEIEKIGVSHDIRSVAREYLSNGPKEYKEIAPLILLGEKTKETKPFYDLSIKLSVVHLFVISGFHISLFYLITTKLFKVLKIDIKIASWISIIIIFIYLFLLNFPISATRAGLLTVLMFINKKYLNNKYSSLKILAFVMALFSIYHPWIIKSLSFIFTFVATGSILFLNTFNFKSKWKKNILIVFGVYLSTIFIAITINGYISIFGIFFGVMLTPIFSFLFIISLFLFPLKDFMSIIYYYFEILLYSLNSINILITIHSFSKEIAQIIYLIIFSCFIIIKIWNSSMVQKNI